MRRVMAGGSGSENDPYLICTPDQLAEITSHGSDHFLVQSDLYFKYGDTNGDGVVDGSDVSTYRTGSGWDPISGFNAVFDGGSFNIHDLYIDRPSTTRIGLFSWNGSAFKKCEFSQYLPPRRRSSWSTFWVRKWRPLHQYSL